MNYYLYEDFKSDVLLTIISILSKFESFKINDYEHLIRYIKKSTKNIYLKYIKDKYQQHNLTIEFNDSILMKYALSDDHLIINLSSILDEEDILILHSFYRDNKLLTQKEVAELFNTSQQRISYKLTKIKKKLSKYFQEE